MAGQHLRLFVACGTGAPFHRLLHAAASLVTREGVELFVQRGAESDRFAHLPGAPLISRDEFASKLSWANVVVCHGGAGTLYEAHRAGHVPVAMPRLLRFGEHVNDHQEELVDALARRQLAFSLQAEDELPRLIQLSAERKTSRAHSSSDLPLVRAVAAAVLDTSSTTRKRTQGLLRLPEAVARRIVTRVSKRP